MDKFVVFLTVFVVVFLLYFVTVILNKKKKSEIFNTSQAKLIIDSNKLDVSCIDKSCFVYILSLSNSFIVALVFTISEFFKSYILKLVVSFFSLIILILIVYRIIGYIYKKKEGKNNV